MKEAIRQLEPKALWGYFYDLTQIPRPSGHLKDIQDFLFNFGQSLGLTTIKDEAGNILIRKPATPGMENSPAVVLQAHMDMVPQKNSDVTHDFEKDSIKPRIDGEWLKATGTTLGGDDGIGVAAIMAVLASDSILHGPVEGVFTADEETGMYGAFGMKAGFFEGRTLLNLDSETEGNLYIGCAGGIDVTAEFNYQKFVAVPKGDIAIQLTLTGLKGGHSGLEIAEGRGNANKLLGSFIKQIIGEYDARLASFEGGSMRNAIPREATAVITIQEENLDILDDSIYDYEALINEAYNGVEGHLTLSFQQVDLPAGLIPEEVQDDFINALEGVHNGVLRAFPDMPETVETSSNLAIINSQEGNITCMFLVRSASEFMKKQLVSMTCFNINGLH